VHYNIFSVDGIHSAFFLIVDYSTTIYYFRFICTFLFFFFSFNRHNIDVIGNTLHLVLDSKLCWEGCCLLACTFIATLFTVYKYEKEHKMINLRDDKLTT